MIEEVELKPSVSALIQSLRSIGYSFNAAVSDIIDNSIAANASEINVQIDSDSAGLFVAISDNGEGMNRDELLQAMALGSKNPLEKRRNDDLGRFGMGLKTASFSQSKILTCVTSKSGKRIGAQWDLDRVVDGWKIQLFDDSACDQLVPSDLTHQDRGTTVVWRNCDRVLENLENTDMIEHLIGNLIKELREHLALIFHKFLDKSRSIKLSIALNGREITPKDPFFRLTKTSSNLASTLILDEKLPVNGGEIEIRGYILPHPSKVTTRELAHKVSIDGDHFSGQGFYVYRAHRLLAWGSWFRILPKNESNKLARVELNIPNTMDELWRLDIKKSAVELPSEVRTQLKKKVEKLGLKSRNTFTRRPSIIRPGSNPVWLRCLDSERKAINYKIDRNHDLVKDINAKLNIDSISIDVLLSLVELTIPLRSIENDLASDFNLGRFVDEDITEDVKLCIDALLKLDFDKVKIIDYMQQDNAASVGVVDAIRRYLEQVIEAD